MNKRVWFKQIFTLGLSALIFSFSSITVFATDTISIAYDNLASAKPYTQNYTESAQKLFDEMKANPPADEAFKLKATTLLDSATARIDFMQEDTISRLGDVRDVTVKNFRYVRETLDEISSIYKLPMMKHHSPQNDAIFNKFRMITAEFPDHEKFITELEATIDSLTPESDTDLLFETIQKGNEYYRLISKEHYKKIQTLAKESLFYDSKVLSHTIKKSDLNLSALSANSPLKKEEIKSELPASLEKQILTGYKITDSFKLTYDGGGGMVSPTAFKLDSVAQGGYLVHAECLPLRDVDDNNKTITFETEWLGDYYVVEPIDFYPYTTNYNSKMEWRFQNASMAKLIYTAKSTSADTVDFKPNNIQSVPRSVINAISQTGKTIIIKGNPDVSLLPAAFNALTVKDEILPVELLYSHAKSTEKKPEYLETADKPASSEDKIQKYPADLFKEDPNTVGAPSLTRILSIAGIIVALATISYRIKKEVKKKTSIG